MLLHAYGNPVSSILVFHYLFSLIGLFGYKINIPIGFLYTWAVLLYQAVYFALLYKYTAPKDHVRYLKAYITRKNWSLPCFQAVTLGFLVYDPVNFFIGGFCANGLLTFYWPAHVETIHELNEMAVEDIAIQLTLMED
jgi:hypothetical protein